jgi:hypothetical protein
LAGPPPLPLPLKARQRAGGTLAADAELLIDVDPFDAADAGAQFMERLTLFRETQIRFVKTPDVLNKALKSEALAPVLSDKPAEQRQAWLASVIEVDAPSAMTIRVRCAAGRNHEEN